MKKLLALLLVLLLCFSCLLSCDENEESSSESSSVEAPSESESSSSESSSVEAPSESESSSSESSSVIEPSDAPKAPNETKTQVKHTEKYYRQISLKYYKITNTPVSDAEKEVFSDGIFELNQTSQYKIISSHDGLEAFSLLNPSEVEADLFEENRVIAILDYYLGPSDPAEAPSGFYNLAFNENNELQITMDLFRTSLTTTEDKSNVYELYLVVVPNSVLESANQSGIAAINKNYLEEYNDYNIYEVEKTVEKTEAYYVENRESREKIEILDGLGWLPSYPFIAIHLENPLETDFVVNSFKYENGEIYLTVQIFGKKEMEMFDFPANLITVSLQPIDGGYEVPLPDNMPSDCAINITLEYVS